MPTIYHVSSKNVDNSTLGLSIISGKVLLKFAVKNTTKMKKQMFLNLCTKLPIQNYEAHSHHVKAGAKAKKIKELANNYFHFLFRFPPVWTGLKQHLMFKKVEWSKQHFQR